MTFNIRIIRTSSREKTDLLPSRIKELEDRGATVVYDEIPSNASWPYAAGSIQDRCKALENALLESTTDYVWVARGGYGASDLLPHLNWTKLKGAKPKVVIGFSDVSALHAALYTKLGWQGLHAPMPATTLWRKDGEDDIEQTIALLGADRWSGSITCKPFKNAGATEGKLLGGCMSVLNNLIGTDYLPKSLAGHVLFFEDTGENPGRLARFWNQWFQSGALQGVKAVVLGAFRDMDADNTWTNQGLAAAFHERAPNIPIFLSDDFGHVSPNFPLMIGAHAKIRDGQLAWQETL